jgi:hypothetical protein
MDVFKFITGIFEAGGTERTIIFPFEVQHETAWSSFTQGNPHAQPVSAGMFFEHMGRVEKVFGNSESMAHRNNGEPIPARPELDHTLIQRTLASDARQRYDLRLAYYQNLYKSPKPCHSTQQIGIG